MFGEILSIIDNKVKIIIKTDKQEIGNIINYHAVFEDKDYKVVGEIINIENNVAEILLVGEIRNNQFNTGFAKKPTFKAVCRLITKEELEYVLGPEAIDENNFYLGRSKIYDDYQINIDINELLSNHFAILGNTGSGKSFAVSRIIQNIFQTTNLIPYRANILLFDAYGEYTRAFGEISKIDSNLNYKVFTTNTKAKENIIKIPLWLLGIDDIALLLDADRASQLPIIEKALKLVGVFARSEELVLAHKNDIIARAVLDILLSGRKASIIRDQVTAILTEYNTSELSLESKIVQPGYIRTLKQCLFVDQTGKMQEMEIVTIFIQGFIQENLELTLPDQTFPYSLKQLEDAFNFALISEGIFNSERVYDDVNILKVRLHSLVNSEYSEFFKLDKHLSKEHFIKDLLSTADGKKAQIINFNINYVDDRLAKVITKIYSKLIFDFTANLNPRGLLPFHIFVEEAHRYVQEDNDTKVLGYNIFERIAKEGRKYGVMLGLISQRPSEISETSISQCSNFVVFRMQHPRDLNYIKEMVPDITIEIIEKLKTLNPGTAIAFGSAFRIPMAISFDKPVPEPLSNNCNVKESWFIKK